LTVLSRPSPFRLLLCIAVGAATLSCADGGPTAARSTTSGPSGTPIVPAKPIITLSTDSVVGTALSGAAMLEYGISIGAGDTTHVRGLTSAIGGLADGDHGEWLSIQLDSANAPAKLIVRLDPRTATTGLHVATVSIAATGADPKIVRVRLTVRARPVLVIDSAARQIEALLGDSLAALAVAIRSSGDTISQLAIGTPECDTRAWMAAKLSSDATPAAAIMTFNIGGLAAGTHSCRVDVRSAQSLVDSATRTIVVTLTLHQAPRIALDQTAIVQSVLAGDPAPSTSVLVSNAGTGTLDGLTLGPVDFGTGPSGWLSAALDSSVAPTAIRFAASARTLGAGTYTAIITVRSSAAGVVNSTASVSVTLTVRPKEFQLEISPTAISISASISNPGQFTTASVSLLDANNSGTTATLSLFYPIVVPQLPNCPPITIVGPLATTPVVPQTNTFMVSPYNAKIVQTCTSTFLVRLTNGQSGTFTVTASVTP
jgi:hypothetical protein